jgi:hypothetical protein
LFGNDNSNTSRTTSAKAILELHRLRALFRWWVTLPFFVGSVTAGRGMGRDLKLLLVLGLPLISASLSGCLTPGADPLVPVAANNSSKIAPELIIGRWGLAAYHKEADRVRTTTEARAQCNKPYVIDLGPNGGVMMNLADDPKVQELVLKTASGDKMFIGPPGDAGGINDREIISFDKDVFITQWVDPEVVARYGTMIYSRCAPKSARG